MSTSRYVSVEVAGDPTVVDLLAPVRVTIDTTGAAPILNTVDYVNGTITVQGLPEPYSGSLQIRGRGNSTWAPDKKPYRLKLGTAHSLVPGVAADRDWVLLALYFDPAYIRTAIATELGKRALGLEWTPDFRFVQVTLNGSYRGLYLLGEHVKVAAYRIPIDKPGAATSGLALTGGYSMELDERLESEGSHGFRTAIYNEPIAMDDPDDTVPAQKAYIEDWFNDFETALTATDWKDPVTGYARFIDQDSWIDWFLVTELSAVHDAQDFSSIKLYKKRDTVSSPGRLFMGPIWDFDNSMGNYFRNPETLGWTARAIPWYDRIMGDPTFYQAVRDRWRVMRANLDWIDGYIDWTLKAIWPYAIKDQAVWSFSGSRESYRAELVTWFATRAAWLDDQFNPVPATVTETV